MRLKDYTKLNLKSFATICVILLVVLGFFILLRYTKNFDSKCRDSSNIASIRIEGDLVSSMAYVDENQTKSSVISRDIVNAIEKADQNNRIKAILLEIDSYGGIVGAGEEIVRALQHTHKPTIAYIRGNGFSMAYWIASATNWIISLETSGLGAIGLTQSYTDNSIQNKDNGITFNQLSTGKYKDMLNSDKPLTTEERALIMKNIAQVNEVIIADIARNRKMSIEKVRNLADGSPIVADTALRDGLIDKVGDTNTVKEYIQNLIHSNPKICLVNP